MRIFILLMLISMTTIAQKPKWEKLFDGNEESLKNWYSWKINDGQSTKGWSVVNGELTSDGQGGDLVTKNEFGDFILEFEFKISPKGNSGLIYKVLNKDGVKDQPYKYGPEYQIIDDVNYPSKVENIHKTGANYDIYAPSDFTAVKPAGEWNKGKITVRYNHVEHWVNDKLVVSYNYASEQWNKDVAKSKFRTWPYANPHQKGKISLQGHGDKVWFKNIRIKEFN